MTEPATAAPRRAAILFIFVTAVIDVLSLGIIIPVLPTLVQEFTGDTVHTAQIYGLFATAWALMQFVFSPILGMVSDRFGRRPVILISCLGLGLDYIFMALAPSLMWLFVGRVISGITASSFATAGAYIADVTPPEKRAAGYGLIGAAFGVGFTLGPALGGWLGHIDPRWPFWGAAVLALLNFAYGLFVLPESLPPEKRAPRFVWKKANPVGSLKLLHSHPELLGLAGVYFLFQLTHHVFSSTFVLYTAYRYGWNTQMVGWSLTAVGVCGIIVQGGLVRRVVKRFGERPTLLTGLVLGTLGLTLWALAYKPSLFWPGLPLISLMGLFGPAAMGLMSRHVRPDEQGQLQGANASIMGITGLIGPGLFTLTFAHFIDPTQTTHLLPGAPMWLAAGMLAAGLVLAIWVTRRGAAAAAQAT